MTPSAGTVARCRIEVVGVVQGVGFRPFVLRLANELGLSGHVRNHSAGVSIEIQGSSATVDEFRRRLVAQAPPLARVESIAVQSIPARAGGGFSIVESSATSGPRTFVPPDVAVCDDCMSEVLDPADRRFRYPFANCTNCGPRFTIIRDLPYDRRSTTMAGFPMCVECVAEYSDPSNRRYHAQPIACPTCGPRLAFDCDGEHVLGTDAVLSATFRCVARGGVVAVKGIGGYHLACDATNDSALTMLRDRKGRVDKPFAVMAASLEVARTLAWIDADEADAMLSPARPIVLVRRRPEAMLSPLVAPGNPLIGIMLPYSPLHHLLFVSTPDGSEPTPVLVLTSGNLSNEPICTDDDDARTRLAPLADAFLTHDRPIHVPCDDSVIRIVDGHLQPVRRSRGYAPLPVSLPIDVEPTLAVGGELKNTFCIAAGRHAWVGPHVGDMENLETLIAFERGVDGFQRMYAVEPEVIATDGHPGYLTRRWALDHAAGRRVVQVQHHHAHIAAIMAEHGLDGSSPVLGFAFDGTGYGVGDDGAPEIWGGEVLVADYSGFRRVGHLRSLPLPGGDEGVRNGCRTAVAWLTALGFELHPWLPPVAACEQVELEVVQQQVRRNVGCAPTTSMGRLFDVVASMLGVRHRVSYEAQAAIELESLAERGTELEGRGLAFGVGGGIIDPAPVLRGIIDGLSSGVDPADLALEFHIAVADAVQRSALVVDPARSMKVALSGGVFQNALLARLTRLDLEAHGFEVLTHHLVPPNDGGLSLGQAIIAGRGRR